MSTLATGVVLIAPIVAVAVIEYRVRRRLAALDRELRKR